MPEAPQLEEYQRYAPFTRLARFIFRVTLLSRTTLQILGMSNFISGELRDLARILAASDDRSDVYLGRLQQIVNQGEFFDDTQSSRYLDSVTLANEYRALETHRLNDSTEMQFKTRRFDEVFERLDAKYDLENVIAANLSRRQRRKLKVGGEDAFAAATSVLSSLAAGVPFIGAALAELIDAIADALRQLLGSRFKSLVRKVLTGRGEKVNAQIEEETT